LNFSVSIWICKHFPITVSSDLQAVCQNCWEKTLEAFPENSLNLKSKASHKCASKKFPGTLLNCLQKIPGTLSKLPPKLSWHFAKSATKNYTGTLPNASTLLALLKTARNNFSRPYLM
jgi:hypothetical protein